MKMEASSSMPSPTMSSSGSMSDTTSMPMARMDMTFYTSISTTLYSDTWRPSNSSQYAGTCIFLIVLATTFRALFEFRGLQEQKWQRQELDRRYVVASAGDKPKHAPPQSDETKSIGSYSAIGSEQNVRRGQSLSIRPWRLTQDGPRACLDVVIAGVGYLL